MNRIFCNFRVVSHKFSLKNVHTCLVACARTNETRKNPGVSKRAEVFKHDAEFIESLEDEEDIAGLESNFADADVSFNEHKRMNQDRKIKVGRMITKKKYFADPPQPSMLTWLERIQIKKLHSEDPETWNLDVLAESFPATREVISKILKQKWQPDNLKKMKKMDARVHENWLLLAEGRLEVDPVLLEHLKRFLPRREDHLAELETKDIAGLLEPPKEKPVWNNGQMSKILESYEKALDALEVKKARVVMIDAKNDREVIDERVELEKLNLEDADSVVIGGDGKSKPTTLSNLKESLIVKETKGSVLNPFEKIIVDQETKEKAPVNSRLSKLAGYTQEKKSAKRISQKTALSTPVLPLPSEKISTKPSQPDFEEIFEKPSKPVIEKISEEVTVKSEEISEKPLRNSQNTVTGDLSLSEKSETDVEADSIEDTFFWPSADSKKIAPKEANSAKKKKSPTYNYEYPQRIKIPKHQKGSGLTFQVNDCFYDDDGEFLYRVPGMTVENKS